MFERFWKGSGRQAIRRTFDDGLLLLDGEGPTVSIGWDKSGTISVTRVRLNAIGDLERGDPTALHLDFDVASGELISDEIDPAVVPKPGELKPRRSALAVLTEAVIRTLDAPSPF